MPCYVHSWEWFLVVHSSRSGQLILACRQTATWHLHHLLVFPPNWFIIKHASYATLKIGGHGSVWAASRPVRVLMATPRSSERLDASDSLDSRSAVDEQTEKGRRNVAQKFLHSKAVRLMTGGKKRGNGSVTALTEQEHSPAHVQILWLR